MSLYNIDETAFVEAPEGAASLEFQDEKQQGRFELGVSMLVYTWDALDIAVVNQWGGPDSADKRDWITGVVVDLFKVNKIVDVVLVEETLIYAMVDEFDTNVEDDSGLVIASNIVKLYEECYAMNYTRVEEMYTKYLEKEKNNQGKPNTRTVHIHGNEGSSSEEDGEYSEDDDDVEMLELVADEEEVHVIPEPVVDDDGFELVQKKGRKQHH